MFASPQAWQLLVQIFIIATALIAANIVRRKVRLLSRSLLPSALIGGLLILCLKAIPSFQALLDKSIMELITYHTLGIGFIALALKNNNIESHSSTLKVTETGAVTAATYVLQAIVGLAVSVPLFLLWNKDSFFYTSGLLLPMGFGQGPGQALNIGSTYQIAAEEQGIAFHGVDFGLSIATTGFLVGSLVGVIYMNILRRRGRLRIKTGDFVERYTLRDYEGQNEIPHSDSIDKLTVQVSLVLLVYGAVFLFMNSIQNIDMGGFGKTLKPLIWGFNFLWGTIFGVLLKRLLRRSKEAKLIHREYTNNYLLNRISGLCFDAMIVAGTAAISFDNLRGLWLPLAIICTLGTIFTFLFIRKASDRLYPGYDHEGFFSMFGMLTGTASNGMILLREIDPKFETPAANNLVLQSIPAILFGFPILILVGFAPTSLTNTLISLGILIVLFILFCLFIFRKRRRQ